MKNIKDIAVELNRPLDEVKAIALAKLPKDQYRKNRDKLWVSEDGEATIRLAFEVPLAVPTRFEAIVVRNAPNPCFVYAKVQGKDGLKPVVIPRRLAGKLISKRIVVDAITDASGQTTYRHELLGRPHA